MPVYFSYSSHAFQVNFSVISSSEKHNFSYVELFWQYKRNTFQTSIITDNSYNIEPADNINILNLWEALLCDFQHHPWFESQFWQHDAAIITSWQDWLQPL